MSIVALEKITLLGPLEQKREVLARLQELGCLHLTSLRPAPAEPEKAASPIAEQAYKALKYLKDTPHKRRPVRHAVDFDMGSVVHQALRNQLKLRKARDVRDALQQRIKNLEPWGDFHFPPREDLANHRLWFYIVPLGERRIHRALEALELPWAMVHRDAHRGWVVVISPDQPPADALPVPRIRTGAKSLVQLRRDLEDTEIDIEDLEAKREALTSWLALLERNLNLAEDRAALKFADQQTLDIKDLFAVQGWLPRKRHELVEAFAAEHRLALMTEPASAEDSPPTLYENPPQLAGGQNLVDFYQTPGYHGWDPSVVVFFSFALFFAMILADAGYALVLGGILAWVWKKMGRSDTGRRLRLLFSVVLGASFVYGLLVGSLFGVTPGEDNPLSLLHVLDIKDFDSMMRLSILIGTAHVALANGLLAWHKPTWAQRAPPLGWIAAVAGGLLLWLGQGSAGLTWTAWALLGGGMATLLVFSDTRPVNGALDLAKRVGMGLLSLTNITKIFGDVLSYMRLFALGLASASLALTFNQLAQQVNDAVPGLGLWLSILILLLGHSLNLALSVMSGVVHGLRLNFIEFFNWGISDEGYPFKAFAKKETTSG